MRRGLRVLIVGSMLALPVVAATPSDALKSGKAELRSAGALAFGPSGILFVGDSLGGALLALDTGDTQAVAKAPALDMPAVNEKVAALLGTSVDQISLNDVAVNPVSHRVYVSVTRGSGPEAAPVILRTTAAGGFEELLLEEIPHARVALPNPPTTDAKDFRGQPRRLETITDLEYVDGTVYVAGLSNEEFSSKLRALPYPFRDADAGSSVEIYHGAHGRFETSSPVRTFTTYQIGGEPHILAAYTCTPLVKFPVSSLKPGTKVMGTTIAELGNRNRPLDMFVYSRGGAEYILMSNSSRGVMKLSTDKIGEFAPITARTDVAGVPYETIADLKGVQQLDRYDAERAVVLAVGQSGALDLRTIALP